MSDYFRSKTGVDLASAPKPTAIELNRLKKRVAALESDRDKWKRLFQEANDTLSEIYEDAK